ncbi:MAG: phospholipase D-like domain-containing protein [Kiritimatiellae bacterium]|nr:phospholipase D-like domain-containing protein [Kiritimatiellia bacterium]
MPDLLYAIWPHITAAILLIIDIWAASHAILYKRDPRSATTWIGLIILFPVVGAVLYIFFGINRIQRRATHLRGRAPTALEPRHKEHTFTAPALAPEHQHLASLALAVHRISRAPLLNGNRVTPLQNGDEAYPAMLDAIAQATRSITLCSYIFDHDPTGIRFADALGQAVSRGVEVRVLIDDVGARYSLPPIYSALNRRNIHYAVFMPTFFHWRMPYINLRNHRKILVVDGQTAFTGGMNIRHNNVLTAHTRDAVQDLHFRIEGPVVRQLQQAFVEDWAFATREQLAGEPWFVPLEPRGDILARGIVDGPDEDHDKFRATLHTALACAQHRVRIATPYFLPDPSLVSALNTCSLRGVEVDIVIPKKCNLRAVGWATRAQLWQVLVRGCRVWLTPPPFDHTKLLIVDNAWSHIGSGNWDARSLRLNFEFNVECYSPHLAAELNARLDQKIAAAHPATLAELDARPLPIRLRDGIARLFWPYL